MSTTTATVLIPISTVTIPTVSLETIYWTVTVSTPTPLITSALITSGSGFTLTRTETIALPATSTSTTDQNGNLPPVVNPSVSTGSSTTAAHTSSPTSSSHPSSYIGPETTNDRKQAIVGGLSGTIAGLLFLGILLTFFLRRYKRRRQGELDSEKGFYDTQTRAPTPATRPWTNGTGTGSAGTVRSNLHHAPVGSPIATVDEDHRMIRMSLSHWVRPFAHGHGEGWRDSVLPGALHVVNPDDITRTSPASMPPQTASRPATPSFLRHPRSAIAAALHSTTDGSRAASKSSIPPGSADRPVTHTATYQAPVVLPEITIAHAPSQELLVPAPLKTGSNPTSSTFRSYPSAPSLAMVRQRPPDDPFASHDDNNSRRPYQRLRRPSSLISLERNNHTHTHTHNPSSTTINSPTTTRRISNHLTDLLQTMKSRTQTLANESAHAIRTIRQVSPESTTGSSVWTGDDGCLGAPPDTGRSDPFDLSVSDLGTAGGHASAGGHAGAGGHRSWRKSQNQLNTVGSWNAGNKRPSWAFVEYTAYEGT